MQINILEPDGFSKTALARLRALGSVRCYQSAPVRDFLSEADILFVRLAHRLDGELLAAAPRLKIVVSPTTGHNHIDLDALTRRNIRLLSLKGETEFLETIRATPEHTLGLLIALLRNYAGAFRSRTRAAWDRDTYRGEELADMNIGIIGYGRVGRRLAHYLRAFEARIRWFDPAPAKSADDPGREDDIARLIDWSRAVILCASHDPAAPPILDARKVGALDGRYLVNSARGELIDEEALLSAIEQGRLAGVAVDVICNENGENRLSRWLDLSDTRNVIVTPHIGGATWSSMRATEEFMTNRLAELMEREGAQIFGPYSS